MTSTIKYLGNLRTEMVHISSGSTVITDAPVDNKGKGENFSPTDLVATALGSCMLTIIGIAGNEHGFDITGSTVEIEKIMQANPRKISAININLQIKGQSVYSDKEKLIIEKAAKTCPVALSLHQDILQNIKIIFP